MFSALINRFSVVVKSVSITLLIFGYIFFCVLCIGSKNLEAPNYDDTSDEDITLGKKDLFQVY